MFSASSISAFASHLPLPRTHTRTHSYTHTHPALNKVFKWNILITPERFRKKPDIMIILSCLNLPQHQDEVSIYFYSIKSPFGFLVRCLLIQIYQLPSLHLSCFVIQWKQTPCSFLSLSIPPAQNTFPVLIPEAAPLCLSCACSTFLQAIHLFECIRKVHLPNTYKT